MTKDSGPRIGLIGCGTIGRWHARIAAEHPLARLVAVSDIDEASAAAVAEAHGVDAHGDPQRMLATAQLDAVVIATPEDRHFEHAALCAAAGCAVLIEKPVAPDPAGVAATMKVIEHHGVLAMAGHVERFETGSALLHSAVRDGTCGAVVSILARRQFAPTEAARFAGRSSTLRLLAVHDFDLVRWVHPAPIAEVYAAAGRGEVFRSTGLDDHVITTVRFADGAIAMVESAWTLPRAYVEWTAPATWQPSGNNRLDVFGDAGFVSNDMSMRAAQLVAFDRAEGFRAAGMRHQPVVHGRVRGALKAQFDHFVDAVIHRRTPLVTMQDALRAVSLTAAAEESLATGRPVARIAA